MTMTIKVYDAKTGEGIEVPVSAFGMKKARGFIRKIIRAGHESIISSPTFEIACCFEDYIADYEADIFFVDFDEDIPICDCDIDEECPECMLFDDIDIEDVDNCSCHDKKDRFFQEHGSCEWCYFIG